MSSSQLVVLPILVAVLVVVLKDHLVEHQLLAVAVEPMVILVVHIIQTLLVDLAVVVLANQEEILVEFHHHLLRIRVVKVVMDLDFHQHS